jgi:ubiquitin-protein ligase E3 C
MNYEDDIFDGGARRARVNLSTNTASSSTSLLSNVRKERIAREQRRRDEKAALTIQRIWRGRSGAVESRSGLAENAREGSLVERARKLVGVYKIGVGADGGTIRGLLVDWVESAGRIDGE